MRHCNVAYWPTASASAVQRYVRNWGTSGSAWLALEVTLMTRSVLSGTVVSGPKERWCRRGAAFSRFVIDDFARTDGVSDFGEVADVRNGVAIKNHEISVKSLFDLTFCHGFEI